MSLMPKNPIPSLLILRYSLSGLLFIVGAASPIAIAQNIVDDPANYTWQAGAIGHVQRMGAFFDRSKGQRVTPPVIPAFETDSDPFGSIATTQPGGSTRTSQNAFFANLGANNRTCFTCHEPKTGWARRACKLASMRATALILYFVWSMGQRVRPMTYPPSLHNKRLIVCC